MGSRFGKYHIDRKVAVGGMAEIFQAHTTTGGNVAIKKIHPNLASQLKFVQMFLDEARIVMRLKHEHIVELLDFGKIGETYFFSLEWVDGKALSEIVIRQRQMGIPFPVDMALLVALDVCNGLYYAHSRADQFDRPLNIVHRDISPPNIMMTREGVAKVTDFGIADIREKTTVTQPGIIRGKFSYMSPEQSRGGSIDCRSDIFSLGIVLYELLMSTRLFLRDKEMETIEAVRKCSIPPMRAARGDISPSVESVLSKALAPNMKNRYATAQDFGHAIQEILEKEFPTSNRKKLTKFLKLLFPYEEFQGADKPLSRPAWKTPSITTQESGTITFKEWLLAHRVAVSVAMAVLTVVLAELWVQVGQPVLAMLR